MIVLSYTGVLNICLMIYVWCMVGQSTYNSYTFPPPFHCAIVRVALIIKLIHIHNKEILRLSYLSFKNQSVCDDDGFSCCVSELMAGIYVGDDKVIHFTRRGQEVGTGTALDLLLVSSGPARPRESCPTCTAPQEEHGVVSSCLNCFLAGGVLYRFEYAVSPALFLAKARGGTCTLAVSDEDDVVVHRAKHLLENGFGCYNVFKNNCEDFAIYCKTELLVAEQGRIGQSGQAISIIGGPLAAVLSSPLRMVTTNVYGMAVTAVGVYCASRYATDIGMRGDVVKVPVEELTRRLATGFLQVVESQMPMNLAHQSPQLVTQ